MACERGQATIEWTGLVLLVVWTGLLAVSSTSAFSSVVGLTAWEHGLRHLGTYGAFTCLMLALVYHLYPRMCGRTW